MKTKNLLLFIVLLPGLVGFTPPSCGQPAVSPRSLALPVPTSAFGYSVTTPLPYNWRDISAEPDADISAQFGELVDDGSVPVDLGFEFPFFEDIYRRMFVSINGLLLFSADLENDPNSVLTDKYSESTFIPFLEEPNNFIAPFWDDLYLGDITETGNFRRVYYHVYNTETPKTAVVQWYVTRRDEMEVLEFQAILIENGNIIFNYKTLDGNVSSATVGIEDKDGVDGMQSVYHGTGLSNNLAIGYSHPGSPRLSGKASTHILGGFLSNGQVTFPFWVQNTGTSSSRFSLVADLVDTNAGYDWNVQFLEDDGVTILKNVAGDSEVDTPPLQPGERMNLFARITGPADAATSSFARFNLAVYAMNASNRKFDIEVNVAVPAPFAQSFVDTGKGMYVQLSRANDISNIFAVDYFTGSTLTMSETARFGMIFAWEHQQQYHDSTANIEYVLVNSLANVNSEIRTIQSNENYVKDEYPKVTVAPNGRIGFMFNRKVFDPSLLFWIDNTFFVILEPDGSYVGGKEPFSVSNNSEPAGQKSENERYLGPSYIAAPSLAITSDNRFMLAWQESRPSGEQQSDDLFIQVFNSDGFADPGTPAPAKLTNSEPGVTRYINPDLTELPGDQFLLTYTLYDQASSQNYIGYRVLDASGGEVRGERIIPGVQGQRVEAAFLGNDSGHMLLAWSNPDTRRIGYAVLDANMDLIPESLKELDSPSKLDMDFPSVTRDQNENGIITWGDTSDLYLYYALVDSFGELLTPPMTFRSGGSPEYPRIKTSQAGEGNTTLSTEYIYRRFMPYSMFKGR